MIYLIGSNAKFKGVKTLILNQIKPFKFSLNLSDFNALIITSKNAINALGFNKTKPIKNLQIYAIGSASAKAAKLFGFNEIYTSKNSHGDEFAREILALLKGKKVLFLRAEKTASNIAKILLENDINLSEIIAYKNVFKPVLKELKPPQKSVLIFSAPSAVRNFALNFNWQNDNPEGYKCVAIGKTTAKELAKFCEPLISDEQSLKACIKLALKI